MYPLKSFRYSRWLTAHAKTLSANIGKNLGGALFYNSVLTQQTEMPLQWNLNYGLSIAKQIRQYYGETCGAVIFSLYFSKLHTFLFFQLLNLWPILSYTDKFLAFYHQRQPPRGVLKKRCSENMQQIYSRTLMPKCDFNKVASNVGWLLLYHFHGRW